MMQKIKYAIAFLAGTVYASAWWATRFIDINDINMIFPAVVIFFGGAGILVSIVVSISMHWND